MSCIFFIDYESKVDSLIICGGMAFTFKKTLESVSVRVLDLGHG